MDRERNIGNRKAGRRVAHLAAFVIAAAALVVPGTAARAAVATVPNGLTTTDLNAVGMSPTAVASALVGSGVSVSNVTFSGANAQAGLIHLVDPAVVSFNDGVILSSGNIADVIGPNKSESTTGDMAGPADADLTALIANTQTVNPTTYDATVLEFDFVPSASQVYFTYTFGSDEYLEWVNLFNDVFAFYVNGQNCATTPGGEAVSIDTINSTVNPTLYRDNSFISPPANLINIEPDGLTVEMICSAPVNAGVTNHMKLAIADTSDQILDSVVMLKSQSLSTTKPESCNDGIDNDDDILVDDADPSCQTTTTPPPPGAGGIGGGGSSPPFTGNEGTPILLDASSQGWDATLDTVSTTWEVTGINGTPGSCVVSPSGPQPLAPGGTIAVVTATCPNEGEYVAHVWGWDIEGSSSFDFDVDFFVHNAPPAVTITDPPTGTEVSVGVPQSVSANVADAGVNDSISCLINWGDATSGTGSLAGGVCTGSHAYLSPDALIITVTATDDAGDSSADKTVVSVVAAPTGIAGTVTDNSSGLGIDGIVIGIYPIAGTGQLAATTTSGGGLYQFPNWTPGTYRLRAYDKTGAYRGEWNLNASKWADAANVVVGSGQVVVDFGLDHATGMSGTVLDSLTGDPLSGVTVSAYDASGGIRAVTTTAANGTYRFGDLLAGSYFAKFSHPSHFSEWFDSSPTSRNATMINVTTGGVSTLADARLTPTSSPAISGTVTASGSPVAGARVRVFTAAGWYATATTDGSGAYAIGVLPAGTYYVKFENALGLGTEWWDHGHLFGNATPLVFDGSTPLSNIDGTV